MQPSSVLRAERWEKRVAHSVQQYFLPRFQGQPSTRDQVDQEEEERDQQEVNYLGLWLCLWGIEYSVLIYSIRCSIKL